MPHDETSNKKPREIEKKDLQTQQLTEKQHLENRTSLLENIQQELATGSLAVDITDWLKNQFVTARNNERLHAELLRTSDFFDLFPVLKNWDELTQFLRNNFGGVGYTTTLLLKEQGSDTPVAQQVQLSFDLLELKKLADWYHRQANDSITKGGMITQDLGLSAIVRTLSKVFVDASRT